jgi:hypothetical protein
VIDENSGRHRAETLDERSERLLLEEELTLLRLHQRVLQEEVDWRIKRLYDINYGEELAP